MFSEEQHLEMENQWSNSSNLSYPVMLYNDTLCIKCFPSPFNDTLLMSKPPVDRSGLNGSDILYLTLLFGTLVLGPLIKQIHSPRKRQLTSTLVGILLGSFVFRFEILHPMVMVCINALIVTILPKRQIALTSLIFCFSYLTFFRLPTLFQIPEFSAHLNALMMILTLKMVGLAFEIRDNHELDVNFSQIFHYAFCYAGLFIGPYYKYQTYQDWIHLPYYSAAKTFTPLIIRLSKIFIYLTMFYYGNFYYTPKIIYTGEFYSESFLYRLYYVNRLYLQLRLRFYVGFLLTECICIAAGLGAYPTITQPKPGQGPTIPLQFQCRNKENLRNLAYNFETVKAIHDIKCIFAISVHDEIRNWNTTVQFWLAQYIFKQSPKMLRKMITAFVSALWHGIHFGYYCSLFPLFITYQAEEALAIYVNRMVNSKSTRYYILLFYKTFVLSYIGIPFIVLTKEHVLAVYSSVYFYGSWIQILLFLSFYIYKAFQSKCQNFYSK